jgi:hypothetical protein
MNRHVDLRSVIAHRDGRRRGPISRRLILLIAATHHD